MDILNGYMWVIGMSILITHLLMEQVQVSWNPTQGYPLLANDHC